MGGVLGLVGSLALLPWLSAWHPLPEFPHQRGRQSRCLHLPSRPAVGAAEWSAVRHGSLKAGAEADPYHVIKASRFDRRSGGSLCATCCWRDRSPSAPCSSPHRWSPCAAWSGRCTATWVPTADAWLVGTDLAMARYSSDQQPIIQRRMLDNRPHSRCDRGGLRGPLPLNLGTAQDLFTDSTTD